MKKTLILYESKYGTTEKVARTLSFILGPARLCNVKKEFNDINEFENLVIAFPLYENNFAENIITYFDKHKFDLAEKRVSIVIVGLSKEDGIKAALKLKDIINKNDIYYYFIHGESDIYKFQDKNVITCGIKIKEYFEKPIKEAPREIIKKEIDKFINSNNTCTISTGYNNFIRSTPIEYKYFKDDFYFISEGGLKFVGILNNKNISMSIYEDYTSMSNLKGLQISGEVKILDYFSDEYEEVLRLNKINIDSFKKLNVSMNIFKVKPNKYEYINSDFKKMGYDSKQIYIKL